MKRNQPVNQGVLAPLYSFFARFALKSWLKKLKLIIETDKACFRANHGLLDLQHRR